MPPSSLQHRSGGGGDVGVACGCSGTAGKSSSRGVGGRVARGARVHVGGCPYDEALFYGIGLGQYRVLFHNASANARRSKIFSLNNNVAICN